MKKITNITGVVLAGGKSFRFGRNKAFARFRGVPLIERVLEAMCSVFKRVVIVSNSPREYEYLELPVIKDVIPYRGPLGGIFTALLYAQNDRIFVTACDLPLLDKWVIQTVVREGAGFDAAIPVHDGIREYLMALYSRNLRELLTQHLSVEQLSMKEFCRGIKNLRWIPMVGDFALNVNTPLDLEILEKHHAR